MDILSLVPKKEWLGFSQNYSVKRNYVGDILFPDRKTQYLEAEYARISNGMELPTMAAVHAFDTEAKIGVRPSFEKVSVEKLLIKEKINTSERVAMLKRNGVQDGSLPSYIFDDAGRLADSVKARTEKAKMEVLSTGKMTIKENGLNFEIGFGVAESQKKELSDWSLPAADILGDIAGLVAAAEAKGATVNTAMCSKKMLGYMLNNTAIRKQINGTAGSDIYVTKAQIEVLLDTLFGLTLIVNEDKYGIANANNTARTIARFFPEDVFSVFSVIGKAAGTGLWGVTPEEAEYGAYTEKSAKQFITISQWATPDPVATWTKASGVFIPVLPNPAGLAIGKLPE